MTMGGMNANVEAKNKDEKVLGNFGIGERNERGVLLIELIFGWNVFSFTTFFYMLLGKYFYWKSLEDVNGNI